VFKEEYSESVIRLGILGTGQRVTGRGLLKQEKIAIYHSPRSGTPDQPDRANTAKGARF
jgi:hypothetical protein